MGLGSLVLECARDALVLFSFSFFLSVVGM